MVKEQLAIINPIAAHFYTHVLDHDTLDGVQLLVADLDQDRVHTFVLVLNK
jgi:hypothetical protein